MSLFSFQTDDYCGYRIYRLAIWRWAWIWGRELTRARLLGPQVHSQAAEINYMKAHPEIWPPEEDYSGVYAEHHYEVQDKHANAILWEMRNAKKTDGSAD